MKIFLFVCLAAGLASSEKLDRTYLPPPGSKFSGGSPGDIQVPFEFPKETYSSTRPDLQDEVPELELGINRRPIPTRPALGSTQRPGGFTYFQNSYSVPKTTTSYAFTQTTTFAPVDDYEGLDQGAGFVNTSTINEASGLPKYPQTPGQTYQQQQSIRGQSGSQGPNYDQYQQGQNQQASLAPYGSSTQRPQFSNYQNREYLPPVPSGQFSGQESTGQDNFGYPSGRPQGPRYQDGQQFSSTQKPGFIEATQQFNGYPGIPSTTAVPQYQDGRFVTTPGPIVNQQRFGAPTSTQSSQNQFSGSFPSSTVKPQYQDEQRYTPGPMQENQFFSNRNFSSTESHQYKESQRFSTPGRNQRPFVTNQEKFGSLVSGQQNQNQIYPSVTLAPQSQTNQLFSTPGTSLQEFGSRLPGQPNQNQYSGSQKFSSSTSAPQYQTKQHFATPQSAIRDQNQYFGNQNIPSSTGAPQYQDGQRFTSSGPIKQHQYHENQNYQTSTGVPQYQNGHRIDTPGLVQQNQYSINKNIPSTVVPQFQNRKELTTPNNKQRFGSQVPNQQIIPSSQTFVQNSDQQYPSTVAPGTNQQAFITNQQDLDKYTGQTNYNQQFPSSTISPSGLVPVFPSQISNNGGQTMPKYPGQTNYNQQFLSSTTPPQSSVSEPQSQFNDNGIQIVSKYPGQANNIQQFPSSTTAPQGLVPESQSQLNNNRIQTLPKYPEQANYNQQFPSSTTAPQGFVPQSQSQLITNGLQTVSPISGTQQPTFQTGFPVYGTSSPSTSGYSNQRFPTTTTIGPFSIKDIPSKPGAEITTQNRPERPQAAFDRTAEILNYESVLSPEGYSYTYDTSNGIHADETGTVGNGTRAQGGYSYTGDDGKVYSVFYSADENGFQPRGDHLPTPPPIPEAIQRVIEQANRDKESEISDDGTYDEYKYGHMKYNGALNRSRPRNKTMLLFNGADIPDKSENQFGEQNRTTMKPKTENKLGDHEKDKNGEYMYDNKQGLVDGEELNYNDADENDRYDSSKRPKPIKNISTERQRVNRPNGKPSLKMNVNTKSNAFNKDEPVKNEDYYEYSVNGKTDKNENTDNLLQIDDSQNIDDVSQDFNEKSDLINYKDDPNTRTDFHGLNKYLPKPKASDKLNQSDNQRPSVRLDGIRQTGMNKLGTPGSRKEQGSKKMVPNGKQDFGDENRIRVPSRKNKLMQKAKERLQPGQQNTVKSSDDSGIYRDNESVTNEKYNSDDETNSFDGIPDSKLDYQFEKNKTGTDRLTSNERTGINKNIKTLVDEETGYEYSPPQRKFDSERPIKFPSRILSMTRKPIITSQNGIQTTLRPFMTPNVYGDDKEPFEKEIDQYDSQGKFYRPEQSLTAQNQTHSVIKPENRYDANTTPLINENEGFDVTKKPFEQYGISPSRRPFKRPQTTAIPGYGEQYETNQNRYDQLNYNQESRRPSNGVTIGNNILANGEKVENNGFISTTSLPHSGSDSPREYQRPSQYQSTSKPGDFVYYDGTDTPVKNTSVNQHSSIRPGTATVQGQVPSTTYRPQYVFGDKTPSGPITVDGYGRPIPSTDAPAFDRTYRPVNSTNQPSVSSDVYSGKVEDRLRPSVNRFGVTSTQRTPGLYKGTSPAPIRGEDFSGPKQPQRFDPDTGYHYK